MISSRRVYWEILKETHTPFIFLLDTEYLPTVKITVLENIDLVKNLNYIPNLMDCDNYAFALKGYADIKGNAIGIVYGKYKGLAHTWNIAILGYGIIQIEPQHGIITDKKLYSARVVII